MKRTVMVWATVMVTGTVAMLVFAGCSSDPEDKDATVSPGAGTPDAVAQSSGKPLAPLELSIMLPAFKTYSPKDDSPVVAELEKLTNTNIHFKWVTNASYVDKVNITLASGKLPTIMYVADIKAPSFVNAARSGAFWEVSADVLKDYPNLRQANPVIMSNTSIDGKNYGIYRALAMGRNGLVYRKDWLEAVGLPAPKTIDDFYNMLKAFKEKDPDKNGKADTYGMVMAKWTGQWASGFDTIKLWFGAPNKWGMKEGKLVPDVLYEEYMDSLKFMRKLYDEKLINADFVILDSARWTDPIVNNQAGVIVDVVDTAARIDSRIHEALKQAGKEAPESVSFMDIAAGVTGPDHTMHTLPTSGFAGHLVIGKYAVKTEAEFKRVLTFLDQMCEPKESGLASYGMEGKHYTKYDSYIEPSKDTVLLESEVEGLSLMLPMIPQDRSGLNVRQTPLHMRQDKQQIENIQYMVSNPVEGFISTVYSLKGQRLDNIINDARIKYIVGQLDEEGMRAALDTWKKSGGDELVEEMNELYAAAKK
jgi:putative aldouronate transport system substrate-binding protein